MAKPNKQNENQSSDLDAKTDDAKVDNELPSAPEESLEEKKEVEMPAPLLIPTKVTLKENYKFEVPVVGRPDVFVNVTFKAKQEITDAHTIKHLMDANAPISIEY